MAQERVALGDLIRLEYGKALRQRDCCGYGGVAVMGSNGQTAEHDKCLAKGPGIIVGRKGSAGKVTWVDSDFWASDTTFYVIPKRELHLKWLYHALQQAHFDELIITTGVPGLNRDDAYKVIIDVPPIEEQRRIAELLDEADTLQRLRKEANEKAQRILPALFTDMFGDPETNPMGWTVVPVSDFVQRFQSGKSIASEGEGTPTKHRVLKVSSVSSGYFVADESKPVPDTYSPPKDHFVREGDLLLSRASGSAELVGVTALVDQPAENLLLPDKLWRFVWRSDCKVEPAWALALFQHPFIRAELAHTASGISMRNIPMGKVLKMRVPLPPLEVQSRFASLASELLATATSQTSSSAITDRLATTLRSRLFAEAV